MNEVSIIINGVRYDAVEAPNNFHEEPCDKLDEFTFRFNTRNLGDNERFDLFLRNVA